MGFRNTRNNAADKNSKNGVIKITYIKTTNECIFLLMDIHMVNLIQGQISITVLFNLNAIFVIGMSSKYIYEFNLLKFQWKMRTQNQIKWVVFLRKTSIYYGEEWISIDHAPPIDLFWLFVLCFYWRRAKFNARIINIFTCFKVSTFLFNFYHIWGN